MSRFTSTITRLYARLLRLYPPHFRAEFADEMGEVFAQAVIESSSSWSLLGLCMSELRDLPLSLLREYLRERRKRVLVGTSGVLIMESRLPLQIFRFFSGSLFVVLAVFAIMVVLPFFALGLHLQTAMEVAWGALGPEAFPLYSSSFINHNPLPGLAVWIMLAAPICNVVFGGGVLLILLRFWNRLSARQHRIGVLAVLAGIAPTLFLLLPVGRILAGWWLD